MAMPEVIALQAEVTSLRQDLQQMRKEKDRLTQVLDEVRDNYARELATANRLLQEAQDARAADLVAHRDATSSRPPSIIKSACACSTS